MTDQGAVIKGRCVPLPDPVHLHLYFEYILHQRARRNHTTDDDSAGLIFGSERMSYTRLDRQANAAARVIASKLVRMEAEGGMNKDTAVIGEDTGTIKYKQKDQSDMITDWSHPIIAVDISPGIELIIALLAILKLGVGYVPIDSQSAVNRVKYILNEAKPVCVIVDSQSTFKQDMLTVFCNHLLLDIGDVMTAVHEGGALGESGISQQETLGDGRLLAVVYTSGSTGKPKGVRLCHRTAMNRLHWHWQTFPDTSCTVGCFKTSLLFVDSIVEIFSCLLSLVPLVIVPQKIVSNPEALVSLLEEHSVTRLTLVPSLLRSMLLYIRVSGGASRLPRLTLWTSNSETIPIALIETFFDIFPVASSSKTFVNLYGSTETMADVTCEIFQSPEDVAVKSHEGSVSIGTAIFNSNVYVVNENGGLVTGTGIGELCVSGFNVAAGYLDNEQNRNFSKNPFDSHPDHQIFYRTGDYAQLRDGRLFFEGRRDSQVKVRGQRVNIAEIQRVVEACTDIDRVAVLYHKLSEISSVIVAYYTTQVKKPRMKTQTAIIEACRKSLPHYMVPKPIMVDEIPLQAHTGKVDRVALRKIYEAVYNRQSTLDLGLVNEKELKALSVLAINLSLPSSAISRNSSFFELGGNSVSMISTIVQLKEHNLHVPIEVFSTVRTIQDILDHACGHKSPVFPGPSPFHKYTCKPLHKVPNSEELINIIADSFVEKEPLDTLLGITKAEFLPFSKSLYEAACKSDLSFAVLDSETGRILGGDFLFDFSQPVTVRHHESMAPIVSLFHHFDPIIDDLRQSNPGRLMLNFCLGVRRELCPAEQATLCHFIEHNVLVTAQSHGFVGVITNNTNPATQKICEHFFSYDLLSEYLVCNFNYYGRLVFAHAPKDYKIKLMLRKIAADEKLLLL